MFIFSPTGHEALNMDRIVRASIRCTNGVYYIEFQESNTDEDCNFTWEFDGSPACHTFFKQMIYNLNCPENER